jgi:hypothetical protein
MWLDLVFLLAQFLPLALQSNCLVQQCLEIRKGVTLQLIVERPNQPIQKPFLLIKISVDFIRCIMRQMSELVQVLTNWHASLPQCQELLLLKLDYPWRDVISTEVVPELLPCDVVPVGICSCICIPPVTNLSNKSTSSIKNHLPVNTLNSLQLLSIRLQPIICIQRISWMRVSRRIVAHEFLVPIPGWRRSRLWWLVLMSRHVLNSVGEILNQLHLHFKELLHCRIHSLIDCGGGALFCWLAIWARITDGTSWPPPDLVFTIWSL